MLGGGRFSFHEFSVLVEVKMSKSYRYFAAKRRSFRFMEASTACKRKGEYHGYITCKTCLRTAGSTVSSQGLMGFTDRWVVLNKKMITL